MKVAAVSLAKPVVVVIDVVGGEKLISKKTADLVLTRALLTDALLDELSQTPNVELVAGSAVVSLTRRKADEEAETLAAKALAPLMVQLASGRAEVMGAVRAAAEQRIELELQLKRAAEVMPLRVAASEEEEASP